MTRGSPKEGTAHAQQTQERDTTNKPEYVKGPPPLSPGPGGRSAEGPSPKTGEFGTLPPVALRAATNNFGYIPMLGACAWEMFLYHIGAPILGGRTPLIWMGPAVGAGALAAVFGS